MSDIDTNLTTPTIFIIDGMEATLVGTFNIRWMDYESEHYWDIWGEVYSLPFSQGVIVLAEDPGILMEVHVLDHTGWRNEDPSYTEDDLWLEEDEENLYLRCGTSEFSLSLTPVE